MLIIMQAKEKTTMNQNIQELEKYAVNLNERARQSKLDPVIGRDDEIRRVLQILSRRTKNNPILVGEPGVGKTAISEGIAQRIINGDVPENLKTKTLNGNKVVKHGNKTAGTFNGVKSGREVNLLAE